MHTYRLNRRIVIEKETSAKNALGTPVETFTELKETWATVTYQGGGMRYETEGEIAASDAEFTVRYDSDIDYNCRVKYEDEYYKITHIETIGRKEGLRLRTIRFETD